jgi:hypothetical protein
MRKERRQKYKNGKRVRRKPSSSNTIKGEYEVLSRKS